MLLFTCKGDAGGLAPRVCDPSLQSISVQTAGYSWWARYSPSANDSISSKATLVHARSFCLLPCCLVNHAGVILLVPVDFFIYIFFFLIKETEGLLTCNLRTEITSTFWITAMKRQGAARLCLCPQLTLVQFSARGIRQEALNSKCVVALPFHCCDIKPSKKTREKSSIYTECPKRP